MSLRYRRSFTSPYALTSDFASIFMYGELSGSTLPAEEGAKPTDWNDAYVAGLYDISESDAAAVRSWVADFMFDQVMGAIGLPIRRFCLHHATSR